MFHAIKHYSVICACAHTHLHLQRQRARQIEIDRHIDMEIDRC